MRTMPVDVAAAVEEHENDDVEMGDGDMDGNMELRHGGEDVDMHNAVE